MPRALALTYFAPIVLVSLAIGLGGCRGPCERVCVQLATYAEECGFSVPDGELDACMDGQKGATAEEKDVCREYGDPAVIRNEWTCDDLQAYWDGSAGGSTSDR
jgi:hypothetical protein